MTTNDTSDPTPDPMPDVTPVPPPAADTPPSGVPRAAWRDRVFHLRAVVAVGAAGIILGAAAGAGVSAIGGHDHHGRDLDRAGFGPGQLPQGGQVPGQPGQPGQMPGQPGQQDEGSAQSG